LIPSAAAFREHIFRAVLPVLWESLMYVDGPMRIASHLPAIDRLAASLFAEPSAPE
jgi:hypothetical protein